jgi:hypothetical protein
MDLYSSSGRPVLGTALSQVDQLDVEQQRGVGVESPRRRRAHSVAEGGRNQQRTLAPHLHSGHASSQPEIT